MTKSTKQKPLCAPVPVIFFGRRTVFSSPKVLETKGRHRRLGAEACEGGRGSELRLRSQPLQVTGDRWFQGHPPPRHIHVASHSPTASPHSAGVASFFLLATKWGREGTIRLEVLMEKFWCLSCHLGDTWTPVLSPWDESCTHCARLGRDCLCLRVKARDVGVLPPPLSFPGGLHISWLTPSRGILSANLTVQHSEDTRLLLTPCPPQASLLIPLKQHSAAE